MLQMIRQVFKDPEDKTELALLFANQVSILDFACYIVYRTNQILIWIWQCVMVVTPL